MCQRGRPEFHIIIISERLTIMQARSKEQVMQSMGIENEEPMLKFRITILNYTLYVAAIFSLLFALMHELNINVIGRLQTSTTSMLPPALA